MTTTIYADRTSDIWKWCQAAYSEQGVNLKFPKGTDPRKTYQWRFAAKLAQKTSEWGLDENTTKQFIRTAISYAKRRGLLHKGLSIFCQANMLEECYKQLLAEDHAVQDTAEILRQTRRFLAMSGETLTRQLLRRSHPDAPANITIWFEAGELPAVYMALSMACTAALAKLAISDPDERQRLPKRAELLLLASNLAADVQLKWTAKAILEDDWRPPCR
jgi:hypothetical protein